MPRLVVLGRKCGLGSDDLVIPAALEALSCVLWLLWYAYRFNEHSHFLVSRTDVLWSLVLLVPISLSLLLAVWILRVSLSGTIINTKPRSAMPRLLLIKLTVDIVLIVALVVMTIISASSNTLLDHSTTESLMLAGTKRAWLVIVTAFLSAVHWGGGIATNLSLPPLNVMKVAPQHRNLQRTMSVRSALSERWGIRFASLGRLVGVDNHPALANIAAVFVRFFKDDIDTVPTDILASFLLLEQGQARRLPANLYPCPVPQDERAEEETRPSWMNVHEAKHYMKYAGGVYGWPMYTLKGPLAMFNLASVLFKSRYVPRRLPKNIVNDNLLLGNTTVIKIVTGLTDSDLVYVTYHNRLFEVPFFVALDHKYKSVVVSIRGTLSLEDILTDLVAYESDKELSLSEIVADGSAHEGMTMAARNLKMKLLGEESSGDNKGLLAEAWQKLVKLVGMESAKKYKLVITGHSLGAGVAAILAMLMQHVDLYSDLRCFAFSPPGGLLSRSATDYCIPFVCSVVLGDDVVCRLGLYAAFDLKVRVLDVLKECDIPKHVVFGGWLLRRLFQTFGTWYIDDITDELHFNNPTTQSVVQFTTSIEATIKTTVIERDKHSRLYLPGCVLYIKPTIKRSNFFRTEKTFSTHFCSRDDAIFNEILISPDMISDHVPWAVLDALEYLSNNETENQTVYTS